MFAYKTVVTVDSKGRITVPIKVREELALKQGDLFILEYQAGIIQLIAWDGERDGENNK